MANSKRANGNRSHNTRKKEVIFVKWLKPLDGKRIAKKIMKVTSNDRRCESAGLITPMQSKPIIKTQNKFIAKRCDKV